MEWSTPLQLYALDLNVDLFPVRAVYVVGGWEIDVWWSAVFCLQIPTYESF